MGMLGIRKNIYFTLLLIVQISFDFCPEKSVTPYKLKRIPMNNAVTELTIIIRDKKEIKYK